jgi:hypothetical protein
MADDEQHDQHPAEDEDATTEGSAEGTTDAGQPASESSDDDGAVEDEPDADEDLEDDDVFGDLHGHEFASGQAAVFGTVTLHGRDRDVTTVLDGASALRLLKIFEQRSSGTLADRLDVVTSSVHNAWLVADLDECIAVSWWPGLPKKAPRTAIDPVVDAI